MDGASFKRLFEPLTIGNFTVRNRIVSTTHFSQLPDDRDLRYIEERARGGAGLFGLSAGTGVRDYGLGPAPEGTVGQWDARSPSPLTSKGIALYDDLVIPGLRRRADLLHLHGARGFGQMAHQGAANFWASIRPAIGPSNVPTPLDALVPHSLSVEEIEELVFVFAHSIRRICEAGLDAAEIHGAHGYLVMQFLSPYYNQRTDDWGGSLEKRARFPLAIIAAARKLVGDDFPIGIRLGFEGDGNGAGITIDELVAISRLIAPHVSHISVSGGNNSGVFDGVRTAYISPWHRKPAFNAEAAAAVKAAVGVPVVVTGRIADAALAEGLLADGVADMIGMVRALIADPQLPNKARAGHVDKIRMCLGLSECHHAGRHLTPVTCAVNAAAGREAELEIIAAEKPGTIVVVGAGPAGLEAARVAALRGHKVFLCDERPQLGGTPRLLASDPNRRNLLDHLAFFESVLSELDIELVLGHRVGADDIAAFGADGVVIATGGTPIVPEIPGNGRHNVFQGLDILRGAVPPAGEVTVVGGGNNHLGAPTMAEYLADRGHRVTLFSEQLDFAAGAEDVTRYVTMQRLRRRGVDVHLATRLAEITVDGGLSMDLLTQQTRAFTAGAVVLCCGLIPNDGLYRQLEGRVSNLHLIGDALAPRRIMHATVEGARVGAKI